VDSLKKDERMLALDAKLHKTPSYEGEVIKTLYMHTIVKIVPVSMSRKGRRGKFTKIILNDTVGFVTTSLLIDNKNYQRIKKQTPKLIFTEDGGGSTSGQGTIYTGRRGGRYYYNSSGKKTYIRRK
jgi:hypothetical protein